MANAEREIMDALHENRRWLMVVGVILIVVGVAAILFPLVSSLSATIFVGWLLLISGVVQIFHAFKAQDWSGFLWELLVGLLEAGAGVILLLFPLTGVVALTVFLAVTFIIEGALRTALAFRIRPQTGWGWMLAGGIISALVGILLWAELPSSALWAIGLLVGINLLMAGWSLVMLGMAAGGAPGGAPARA